MHIEQQTTIQWLCDSLVAEAGAPVLDQLAGLSAADWDALVELATLHGVASLLYQRFRDLSPSPSIPTRALQALAVQYLRNAARNNVLYQELAQVLEALRGAGIPNIVLKGAHLAEYVYDDKALRSMWDVDILVHQSDVIRAGETLLSLGYTTRHRWQDAVGSVSKHLPPFQKANAVPVEIHWLIETHIGVANRVVDPLHIDMEGLWERALLVTIAAIPTMVLSPEDLLLHLCIHASLQHKYRVGLRSLYDIHATLKHFETELDWVCLQTRAQQWRAENSAHLTLRLVMDLFKAPVPETVLAKLVSSDFDPRYLTWALEQVCLHPEEPAGLHPGISKLASVREAKHLGHKIITILKIVFPSRQVIAGIYPVAVNSVWIYAYYLVRIKDLLVRYRQISWRLLRGDIDAPAVAERDNRLHTMAKWLANE